MGRLENGICVDRKRRIGNGLVFEKSENSHKEVGFPWTTCCVEIRCDLYSVGRVVVSRLSLSYTLVESTVEKTILQIIGWILGKSNLRANTVHEITTHG